MSWKFTIARTAVAWVSLALLAGVAGAADTPRSAPDAAYQKDYEKWKTELADDLKQNWLPLAGLFWLKPGNNSFGTDEGNALVFPGGPAHGGVFELQGKEVTMKLASDAHATVAGKPVTATKLIPDISENTTLVEMGSLRFHLIVRGERIGIRVKDVESPAVARFRGLVFYPPDLNFRVTAKWEPSSGKKTVDVPNVLGDVTPTPVSGTAVFKISGREVRLTDLGEDPSKGLFFVFHDLTSKSDTYPGGRFLYTGPVVNGTVVLDFNRAHNPPCAVTAYATCPLAPKENRLSLAIPAGEKYHRAHP
jgi:uncharacterized protein (DUF1684 family)